ncbi:CidA/LrgA family protein [Chitinibacter bivalviorum]|uniref:CidA/LrgA family protein n=1 Tax=Chitinibacter bivalviorum TaxID=2739434 RepID=A0A7H9BH98_9NEIS|nr:CidA/LrgA family protein [Chitinibacter bivalviorum]QLG86914.1 CidA/LrgA family protein [Chitinibacter bivalviorum]
MLYGATVIFIALFAGEALVRLAHIPIPGPVLGMLLLTLLALFRRGIDRRVAHFSTSLLRYLALLFIPAGVGLMTLGDKISQHGIALLLTIVFSTLITMGVTGLLLQYLLKRKALQAQAETQKELP